MNNKLILLLKKKYIIYVLIYMYNEYNIIENWSKNKLVLD